MIDILKFEIYNSEFEKVNLEANFVDCIITDPPYMVEFENDIYDDSLNLSKMDIWMKKMSKLLKPGKHIYIFVPSLQIDHWSTYFKKNFELKSIIATKNYNTNKTFKNRFNDSLQLILFGTNKGERPQDFNKIDWIERSKTWLKDKRNRDSYQRYTYNYPSFLNEFSNVKANGYRKLNHPNQKNEDLIQKFIEISTNEGDMVLDPFVGSGSTIEAALKSNRFSTGIESNTEVWKNTGDRMKELSLKINNYSGGII